jgi:hypothetical protein
MCVLRVIRVAYLSMSAIRPISDLQFEAANTETGAIQAPIRFLPTMIFPDKRFR